MRKLSLFLATLAVLACSAEPAEAQASGSYIRQWKDAAKLVFNDTTLAIGSGTSTRVYDTTSFASVLVQLVGVGGSGCVSETWEVPTTSAAVRFRWTATPTPYLDTQTATSLAGPYSTPSNVPNAHRPLQSSVGCVFDLYATLLPWATTTEVRGPREAVSSSGIPTGIYPVLVGGGSLDNPQVLSVLTDGSVAVATEGQSSAGPVTSPVSVTSAAGGTTVCSATSASSAFVDRCTIQNVGNVVLLCRTNGGTPSATAFSFALKADSTGGTPPTGDGGSWTMPYRQSSSSGHVKCIAASGTGSAAIDTW